MYVRACLRRFVRAAFAARRDPALAPQLEAVRARGWDRCPRCRMRLGLEGYRRTETPFFVEEVIVCQRCGARYVLWSEAIH